MQVASYADTAPYEERLATDGNRYASRGPYLDTGGETGSGPLGFFVGLKGGVVKPHFHPVAQFQIVVEGSGRLGVHPLTPITVHYSDPNSPYGPLVPGAEGISYFVLRARPVREIYHMPGARDKMPGKPGRNISKHVTLDMNTGPGEQREDVTMQSVIGQFNDGLTAFALRFREGVKAKVPDPAEGGGQYLLVLSGSLVHDGRELPPLSLLYVSPTDPPALLEAGLSGADVLVAQYPRHAERPA